MQPLQTSIERDDIAVYGNSGLRREGKSWKLGKGRITLLVHENWLTCTFRLVRTIGKFWLFNIVFCHTPAKVQSFYLFPWGIFLPESIFWSKFTSGPTRWIFAKNNPLAGKIIYMHSAHARCHWNKPHLKSVPTRLHNKHRRRPLDPSFIEDLNDLIDFSNGSEDVSIHNLHPTNWYEDRGNEDTYANANAHSDFAHKGPRFSLISHPGFVYIPQALSKIIQNDRSGNHSLNLWMLNINMQQILILFQSRKVKLKTETCKCGICGRPDQVIKIMIMASNLQKTNWKNFVWSIPTVSLPSQTKIALTTKCLINYHGQQLDIIMIGLHAGHILNKINLPCQNKCRFNLVCTLRSKYKYYL